MRTYAILALLILVGCQGPSLKLDSEWLPLEQIKESKIMSSGGYIRTVSKTVYVDDLKDWLERHPEPVFSAILLHECRHAERQAEVGLLEWLQKYATDTDFMWSEEQLGYYEEIVWLTKHGWTFVPEKMAKSLSDYTNLRGSMVDETEALAWINAVLAGQWKPPPN